MTPKGYPYQISSLYSKKWLRYSHFNFRLKTDLLTDGRTKWGIEALSRSLKNKEMKEDMKKRITDSVMEQVLFYVWSLPTFFIWSIPIPSVIMGMIFKAKSNLLVLWTLSVQAEFDLRCSLTWNDIFRNPLYWSWPLGGYVFFPQKCLLAWLKNGQYNCEKATFAITCSLTKRLGINVKSMQCPW